MTIFKLLFRRLPMLAVAFAMFQSASAQDYVEWSTENRTSLSFQVNQAGVSPLLPVGWTLVPVEGAPDRAAVSITFMDRHLVLDGQGQVLRSGTSRYMVMSVQARNEASGQSGTMLVTGISPEGPGAYEVYQPAVQASVEKTSTGQGEASGESRETWTMEAQSGDRAQLSLAYTEATPVRRESRIVLRSGKRPDFTRTYQIDQATDALGRPGEPGSRISQLSFIAAGPLFSRIFDGTEVLTGVTAIPWYSREIFIP
jgi:hypothetical protein